eukprot:gene38710-52294_t
MHGVMSMLFHHQPTDWPSLAAFALGILIGIAALLLARLRAQSAPKVAESGRATISWLWIGVQGLALGLTGYGAIDIVTGLPTAAMLVRAAIVLALVLTAIWLFDSASRTMGKNWSLVARTRSDHHLVQTGPFALVRHPIYVALFLFMLAMAIAYGHTAMLIVAIPIYGLGTWLRVRQEERLLRAMFGNEYDAYAARVKRFLRLRLAPHRPKGRPVGADAPLTREFEADRAIKADIAFERRLQIGRQARPGDTIEPGTHRSAAKALALRCRVTAGDMPVDAIRHRQCARERGAEDAEHRERLAQHRPVAGPRLARSAPHRRCFAAAGDEAHTNGVLVEQQREQARQLAPPHHGIGEDVADRRIVGEGGGEQRRDPRTIGIAGNAGRDGVGHGSALCRAGA